MKKFITVLILLSFVFANPVYASLSWTCPNCGQTYYFDSRDADHMERWTANHLSVCRGDGPTDYEPRGRGTLPGYVFLGGIAGGMLGGIYGLAYSQPEMWSYAAAGAFLGGVAMGLLWIVSAE